MRDFPYRSPRAQEAVIPATAFIQPAAPDNLVALAADWGAADPALAATLRDSQSPIMALTRYGLARYAAGDFKRAAEMFKAVAEAASDQPLAWNNLALALIALGRHEPAVAGLNRSLALDPAQPAIWTSLAGALLQLDRMEEAEAACTQAIALDSRNAAPWQLRALSRAKREDFAGAAAAFARTIEIAGPNATLQSNWGTMLFKCGRFEDAAGSFARAVGLHPAGAEIHGMARMAQFMIAVLAGDIDGATDLYKEEIAAGAPEVDTTFKTALLYLDRFGHHTAAAKVAQAWVKSRPGNAEARHLCDAALGQGADRVPAALVTEQFDAYADGFDDQLVGRLGYDGPEQIAGLLARHMAPEGNLEIFDIGCGTGLCAPILRPYAAHLAGIDLAPRMVEKAGLRGVYDALEAGELLGALERDHGRWDLIVAADVLAYFGDLRGVFEATAQALKPGGYFAFTTESSDSSGFILRVSGRYAHGRDYLTALTAGRFQIVESAPSTIRREGGKPLDGDIFLLRRIDG